MAARAVRGECNALTIRRKLRGVIEARGGNQFAGEMRWMGQIHAPNVHIDASASVSQATLTRDCRGSNALGRKPQPARFAGGGLDPDLPQTRVMEVASAEHDSSPIGSPSRTADIEIFSTEAFRFSSCCQVIRDRQLIKIRDVIRNRSGEGKGT